MITSRYGTAKIRFGKDIFDFQQTRTYNCAGSAEFRGNRRDARGRRSWMANRSSVERLETIVLVFIVLRL